MSDIRDWFMANGGINNKATEELVLNLESKMLAGTGYEFKILRRGKLTIREAPYAKEWRRTVRHSKDVQRGRK